MNESTKRGEDEDDRQGEQVDRTSPAFEGRDATHGRAVEEDQSSKRLERLDKQPEGPVRRTRARRPRSGRSGSDSGASKATRGH